MIDLPLVHLAIVGLTTAIIFGWWYLLNRCGVAIERSEQKREGGAE